MKNILAKLFNKYAVALYATLFSSAALAQPAGFLGANIGWIAAGAMVVATVVGVAAVSASTDDAGS